ncbi:MAG: tripartite tricarboxylate transporter TctB family protein [Pirellulaceae bacterium]
MPPDNQDKRQVGAAEYVLPTPGRTSQKASTQNSSTPGFVWLFFGLFFLLGAIPIARPRTVADADPGPRAIPLCLSFILLSAGIVQTASHLRRTRNSRARQEKLSTPPDQQRHSHLALGFFFSLWVYLAAIWLAGFILATILYATLSMRVLGTRWTTAAVVSALLTAAIYLLFEVVFAVLLPLGWIWG